MRLAIFTETFLPKWDGVANTLCYLLEHLKKRGHKCLMFAPDGRKEARTPSQYAGTRIVGLPCISFPFYPDLKLVPPIVNVAEELATFKPDLVHLVNLASLGIVGMRHARDLGIPVVASYHTDLPGYTRLYGLSLLEDPLWAYFRWLHNHADLNLCPSEFTRTELEAHGFERVAIWGRGVDTENFNPRRRQAAWRERLSGGNPDAPLLLYVGRLAIEKRPEWLRSLVEAAQYHNSVAPRLAIVGDGPLREELEEQFSGTPTVFTGYLKGEDLANAYAAADMFVFPSANETFGNVVLEAMASGLPVIAVRSGGPVDHVHDGINGFLCDPEDPTDFTRTVKRCVEDQKLRQRIAQGARAYAETQTWEAILDSLLEKYERLLASPPPPRQQRPFGKLRNDTSHDSTPLFPGLKACKDVATQYLNFHAR